MRKFFKILTIILGIILFLLIGVFTYGYFKLKKNNEVTQEKNKKIINFQSDISDDYFEYSGNINKSGDFTKGFEYLNKAVQLDPKLHLGYRGWIRLRKMRDYDKALIDFDKLDSLTPNFVDAPWGENIYFLRGECHFGNKDYIKAIASFNRSVKNQKEDWADIQTFVYLGICEYRLGNYEKAISEFKRALKQSESTCEAHFNLALSYEKIGDLYKAIEHIIKAEDNISYKRDDIYNEYLNEIYLSEIIELKQKLNK